MRKFKLVLLGALLFNAVFPAIAFPEYLYEKENLYMEGYVRAVLLERYELNVDAQVRGGDVYLPESVALRDDYEQLIEDISQIKGVKSIKLVTDRQIRRISNVWALPHDTLFRPLVADPRWPKFSAGYQYYSKKINFKNSFEAALGKSFSIFRSGLGESSYTEVGLQTAVFTMFDLDTTSFNLINTDYFAGIPITFQWDSLTWMTRFYHQLSHLGNDFFLAQDEIDRINQSYGTLDSLLSFEPAQVFRLYGGGGYMLYVDSGGYARWHYHTGAEFRIAADSPLVPTTVLALDIKGWKTPNWSGKIGVEINRNTLVSFDIYDGRLPDGQFYSERITKFGLSISYY